MGPSPHPPAAFLKHFGQQLKAKRREARLSQEALADATQLHRTYIGAVERGERNVTLRSLVKLAKGLGLTVGQLIDGL